MKRFSASMRICSVLSSFEQYGQGLYLIVLLKNSQGVVQKYFLWILQYIFTLM